MVAISRLKHLLKDDFLQSLNITSLECAEKILHLKSDQQSLSCNEIKRRAAQIANGWSDLERADRLCAGSDARAWIFSVIERTQTE